MKTLRYTSVPVMALALACFGNNTARAEHETNTTAQADSLSRVERVSRLLGSEVRGSDNRSLGELNNLVVDLESGRILYAVVDTGRENVAVPPGVFTEARGRSLTARTDKEALGDAPRFTSESASASEINKASFVSRVHRHFNQTEWWKGDKPADQGTFNNVHKVTALRGAAVKTVSDANIGKISNLGVDLPAGRVPFVIISPDSSLGLGNALYALPPDAFTQNTKSTEATVFSVNTDKDKLAAAPHFSDSDWAQLNDPTFASKVYSHYGKQAYFNTPGGVTLEPTGRSSSTAYPDDRDVISRPTSRDERDSGWRRGRTTSDREVNSSRNDVLSRPRTSADSRDRDQVRGRDTERRTSTSSTSGDTWDRDQARSSARR